MTMYKLHWRFSLIYGDVGSAALIDNVAVDEPPPPPPPAAAPTATTPKPIHTHLLMPSSSSLEGSGILSVLVAATTLALPATVFTLRGENE